LQNTDGILTAYNFEQYQGIVSYGYITNHGTTTWAIGLTPSVGNYVKPTTANGYQYRCTVAGTTGAVEPTWPTVFSGTTIPQWGTTVTDGGVTWEMDGNDGDEYSMCAPLKVTGQEFLSSENQLICRLYLIGIPNQLAQDKAVSEYTQIDTDTNTLKTLITAIGAATLAPYTTYTAYTVTYDAGWDDGIINAYIPKDYFKVNVNDNRLDKIQELLSYTADKMRIEDDGEIHIYNPVTTGNTYDYEYRLAVDTYHTFFNKALRNRFVNPNKEIVCSSPDHAPQYTGNATSATSFALAPKTHTTYRRLASNAEATAIAGAIIERYELDAEKGSAIVPMNCGQEVWDYILITDARQSDTRAGNVQYIQRHCLSTVFGGTASFDMTIKFGRTNPQGIASYQFTKVGTTADTTKIADKVNQMVDMNNELLSLIMALQDDVIALYGANNTLTDYLLQATMQKLHVTQQLIIPVV
jgi:hypothetical protein